VYNTNLEHVMLSVGTAIANWPEWKYSILLAPQFFVSEWFCWFCYHVKDFRWDASSKQWEVTGELRKRSKSGVWQRRNRDSVSTNGTS
jgi:small conductance mechanosensitive channel